MCSFSMRVWLFQKRVACDGDRLLLGYAAVVTDQFGERVAETERRVAVPLAAFGRHDVRIDRLAADGVRRGHPIPILAGTTCSTGDHPAVAVGDTPEGEPELALCAAGDRLGTLPSTALGRTRTPAWAYPLLACTLVLDLATNPVLLLFAPAVILTGD